MHLFSQDGFLSPDEIKKNTELLFSGAKSKREAKKPDGSNAQAGRCPHAHRVGKKAKETKAKEANDEKKSKDDKDVKDEL